MSISFNWFDDKLFNTSSLISLGLWNAKGSLIIFLISLGNKGNLVINPVGSILKEPDFLQLNLPVSSKVPWNFQTVPVIAPS